jgi:hypothetical protein
MLRLSKAVKEPKLLDNRVGGKDAVPIVFLNEAVDHGEGDRGRPRCRQGARRYTEIPKNRGRGAGASRIEGCRRGGAASPCLPVGSPRPGSGCPLRRRAAATRLACTCVQFIEETKREFHALERTWVASKDAADDGDTRAGFKILAEFVKIR